MVDGDFYVFYFFVGRNLCTLCGNLYTFTIINTAADFSSYDWWITEYFYSLT